MECFNFSLEEAVLLPLYVPFRTAQWPLILNTVLVFCFCGLSLTILLSQTQRNGCFTVNPYVCLYNSLSLPAESTCYLHLLVFACSSVLWVCLSKKKKGRKIQRSLHLKHSVSMVYLSTSKCFSCFAGEMRRFTFYLLRFDFVEVIKYKAFCEVIMIDLV